MLFLCLKSFGGSHCFQDKIQPLRSFKALADLAGTISCHSPYASCGPAIPSEQLTVFWMMHALGGGGVFV